jgi:hypothetical protein
VTVLLFVDILDVVFQTQATGQKRLTQRAADSRYALEKRAGLARKGSGGRPGLPRPARAADAGR